MYAIWPGIKDLEVRSTRRGRERENRTESIAPNYVRARERKGRTLVLGVITRAIETLSGSQLVDGSLNTATGGHVLAPVNYRQISEPSAVRDFFIQIRSGYWNQKWTLSRKSSLVWNSDSKCSK